jgi:hypothetical protein
MIKFGTVLIISVLLTLLSACKSDEEKTEHAIYSSKDFALVENLFSDAFKVMDDVARNTDGIRGFTCIENVVADTASSPMTLMIDFGEANCTDDDGMVREGKLNVSFTGRYLEEGSIITITPDQYKVDGFRLEGSQTITNLGENGAGNLNFNVEIANGEVSHSESSYNVFWESTTNREWVEGQVSWFLIDDAYEISGSGQGTNRNGSSFVAEIIVPLRSEYICPWLTAGEARILPESLAERIVLFGSGECNAEATVTVEGTSYGIGF